jgi:hypothetical protein
VANVTTPRRSLAVADAFFDTTAGSRPPLLIASVRRSSNTFDSHGVRFTEPRRADASRSCAGSASPHRECVLCGERSSCDGFAIVQSQADLLAGVDLVTIPDSAQEPSAPHSESPCMANGSSWKTSARRQRIEAVTAGWRTDGLGNASARLGANYAAAGELVDAS